MAIPASFLDAIRARVPLSSYVGRQLKLARAGAEWKACCPFHNEKSPSFYVNDGKGFFHCFGCGAHGDVIGFAMRHQNLEFVEAIETLAGEAGLVMPERDQPQARQQQERAERLYRALDAAARFFSAELGRSAAGRAAAQYLERRGLGPQAVARFRLGYAPAGGLAEALKAEGIDEADALEVALLKRPEDGRAPYPFFRNRVIFPVEDRRGRVVAFGGRILEGEGPKYVNSPEHPLFHKGALLYNLARARAAVKEGSPPVVVEGYMDAIAMVEAGLETAVAPLGTAITEAQIEALWSICRPGERVPILCLDGDKAGRAAALRAAERVLPLLKPDHSLAFAFLPAGEDPDSLIRASGAAPVRQLLADTTPLATLVWERAAAGRRTETPEARAGLKAELDRLVGTIADRQVQRLYRDEMGRRFDEAFPRFPRRTGAPGRPWSPNGPPGWRGAKPPVPSLPMPRPSRPVDAGDRLQARLLLHHMVLHPELFDELGERFSAWPMPAGPLGALHAAACAVLSSNHGLDSAGLRHHLSALGFDDAVAEVTGALTRQHAAFARDGLTLEAARAGCLEMFDLAERRALDREVRALEAEIASGVAGEDEVARLFALRRQAADESA